MKHIGIVIKGLFLFIIVILITSGCNVETKKKRAEIDQKLKYFETKLDILDRNIDAFNPISLPLDYAMKRYDSIKSDYDTLSTEIDTFEVVLFGDDLFANNPIATKEQRDRYTSLTDRQIGLIDRMQSITLALDAKVNLLK